MKNHKPALIRFGTAILFAVVILVAGCDETVTPKPKGYFRIDFPEKKYVSYQSECGYRFEYPGYGKITPFQGTFVEPCWINIEFPGYKGKIHLTYKKIGNNPGVYAEDIRTLAYKHLIKADDIIEKPVYFPERDVYGMIYDIRGNTASALSFYLTDSTSNFLSGALYFSVMPNKDSLAPVIRFFSQDIDHLIETLHWN